MALNLNFEKRALQEWIASKDRDFLHRGTKGDFVSVKVDAEVAELEQVHPDYGVSILGKFGVFRKATDEYGDVGGVDGTELKVGQRGGFPLELPIEVKALGGAAVELEFIRDFPIYDGDGGARVEDELQVGLGANAAVNLDEVTG